MLLAAGIVLTGFSENMTELLVAAIVYGIAAGILSPALNAWTIDLSQPDHRGKAVATMYIALEAGIGLGALFSGWYYQDVIARIPLLMYISAGIVLLGMVYMLWKERQKVIV